MACQKCLPMQPKQGSLCRKGRALSPRSSTQAVEPRGTSVTCTSARWIPFRDLAEQATDEVMLVAALMTAPDGATKISAIAAGYFGPSAVAERVVRPIKAFDQPIVDTLATISYEQLNAMLDSSFPRGARNYWKSHFCEQLNDAAIDTIVDCHKKCPSPMAAISPVSRRRLKEQGRSARRRQL